MLSVQSSPTTAVFAFAPHDEVVIQGMPYRPLERRPEGYLFQRTDPSGLVEAFDNGNLAQLAQKGRLVHNVGAFLSEEARRRLASTNSLVSAAPEGVSHRSKRRLAFVEAFLELEAKGEIKRTDEAIKAAMPALQERAGEILGLNTADTDKDVEIRPKKVSASALRRWLSKYEDLGVDGLFDAYSRSGYRMRRLGHEVLSIMAPIVARYAQEKVSKEIIIQDVRDAIDEHNAAKTAEGKTDLLEVPSRTTIRAEIMKLDPFKVHLAHHGEAATRKKFAPVGRGLQLTRPLERVEIDEWTIDLVSLVAEGGLTHHLTDAEKEALGLGKKKFRWKVSVAMCATTRCILAMLLTRSASATAAIETIDMITRDKGVWADGFGALTPWNMAGVPELVVTDCGSGYISFEARAAMQDLGIRAERAPAGFPEMRARIERFFLTVIMSLLPRLSGRTLSDVVEKGDADPEARAALTTEELSEALVRWIVDVYHNSPHEGLGGETPGNCWNRLSKLYGVRPAPDMRRRRLVFGTRTIRKVHKKGIRYLGAWYHSKELAQWNFHATDAEVEIRWYKEDIGAIEVNLNGQWVEVPAVLEDLEGVHAEVWYMTVQHLRAAHRREAELARPIVRRALKDIKALNENAMRRQGLVVQDWSDENVRNIEDRFMIGFEVADEPAGTGTDLSRDSSGMGFVLPNDAHPESSDAPATPREVMSDNPLGRHRQPSWPVAPAEGRA
jgi:putative transposase